MRVVHLIDSLEVGGMERFVLDLAEEQKRAGYQPRIYCLHHAGSLALQAQDAGIQVREFGKTKGASPRLLMHLASQLRSDAPDVLHSHNPGVHLYGALAGRLARVPKVINTRHGVMTSAGVTKSEGYFRATLPLTNRIVFVSEDSRKTLTEATGLPPFKSAVIRNGISLTPFTKPATPGSARPRIRFVSVGRMVPVKDQALLIDAFAKLRQRLPEVRLHIAGGGPLFDVLGAQIQRMGLQGQATLEGTTFDVPRLLRDFDIFVLSSISEGLPITILEAMAAGLPIVSTRVGGIPEVAPEGTVAWYCPPKNAEDLAAAMYLAATSPDLERMGLCARELACAHFGIAKAHEQYAAIYQSMLAGR